MSKNNPVHSVEQILSYTITTNSGCMEWQRAIGQHGYGVAWHDGKVTTAHRLVLIFSQGLPETKSVAMHLCDNPPCVNPNHLRWGSYKENSKDMVAKNRHTIKPMYGEGHPNSKLTVDAVKFIRKNYGADYSTKYLAALFGVGITTVSNVLNNKVWR